MQQGITTAEEGYTVIVYGGRSNIARVVVVGVVVRVCAVGVVNGVKWRSQDSSTMCCVVGSMRRREASGEVDEDLVGGQLWDGEEDLEFKGRRWCRGRHGAIDAQGVSKEVGLWGLEVELRVEVSTNHSEQVN